MLYVWAAIVVLALAWVWLWRKACFLERWMHADILANLEIAHENAVHTGKVWRFALALNKSRRRHRKVMEILTKGHEFLTERVLMHELMLGEGGKTLRLKPKETATDD